MGASFVRPWWATVLAAALGGCAHGDDWRIREAEDRDIRVAVYRHFLAGPELDGRLLVNCLGVQTESKKPASGAIGDEARETLAAFRSDPRVRRAPGRQDRDRRRRGRDLQDAHDDSCDGTGYRLHLAREGDRWLVVEVELTWMT